MDKQASLTRFLPSTSHRLSCQIWTIDLEAAQEAQLKVRSQQPKSLILMAIQ